MNINIARFMWCSFVITMATLSSQTASQGPPEMDCELLTLCSCSMSDGSGDIDLTSLSGSNDQPKFKDVLMPMPDESYYYSYSPCGSFSELQCQDAVACLLDHTMEQSQQIGDYGRVDYEYTGNKVVAAYISGLHVITQVNLICDPTACDPIFVANGQQGPGQYEMTLTTICACPGKCSASGPKSGCHSSKGGSVGVFSVGSILLIILFGTLFLYLTAGLAYMRIRKQATRSDMLPNKEFWVVLPTLVVTGGKFVVAKIRRKETKYDQI